MKSLFTKFQVPLSNKAGQVVSTSRVVGVCYHADGWWDRISKDAWVQQGEMKKDLKENNEAVL